MKRILSIVLLFAIACLHQIEARSVTLETGSRFIDTYRTVDIDHFDYIYSIKSIHLGGYFVELEDGSVWRVEELGPETKSFYKATAFPIEEQYVENLVANWQPGERLIFHKVIDRETILIYNIDRDQLFDFVPFSPPKYETINVASIDLWNKTLSLTNGTSWKFTSLCSCKKWKVGDPVLIAKDTPWSKINTHILINLKYCECEATSGHIHPNRVGVHRIE